MKLLDIHEPGQTPLPHEQTRAVGIDLGTTNSVVAVSEEGVAQAISDADHAVIQPSAVFYKDDGSIEVGAGALAQRRSGAKNVVTSIKQFMGRGLAEAKARHSAQPYEMTEGEGMVRLRLAGKELTPVEISAEILKHLRGIAQDAMGKDVTSAVITVPAYFDDAARQATKDAAKLAGLNVLRLINEPTAAALAYGLDNGAEGLYAVFDLGGGTFDMSVLKLEKGVFQVLATGGDTALGGDDFDHAVTEWFANAHGIDLDKLPSETLGALLSAARAAKEALSDADSATLTFEGKSATLSREDFNALIKADVDRAIKICRNVLQDVELDVEEIQGVVMVGGATRVPLVRERVKEVFGREPLVDVNPDEVVAIGAALQAEALTHGSDTLLLDVIPLSLGLETMGGLCEKLIHRNTPIPIATSQEFTTYQDNQNAMIIKVVQGEREMANDNRELALFELAGIPPMPMGMARVKVTFEVDADGMLTVHAQETTTGARQSVHVKPAYGLQPEEIERMLRESMETARTDITTRLLVEARVEAERAIRELESALKEDRDLLTEAENQAVTQQIGVLRRVIRGDDRDMIDVEVQQLGRLAQKFAERRMDRAIASALKGKRVNDVKA